MKKLALLLLFNIFYAQKSYHFFYELHYKKDSTQQNYDKDDYVLDVSENEQKFYNVEYYKNDSISKSNLQKEPIFSYPNLSIRLSYTKNDHKFYNYYTQTPLYYLVITEDIQHWTILPIQKKYNGIHVQKATTKYGGRTWEAWFTNEIPFGYGPYKFQGLPGLILEISDSEKNYIFKFLGNKNTDNQVNTHDFLETEYGVKPILLSEEKWIKLQQESFINPLKDFGDGGLIIENEKGEKVEANSKEIIKQQQAYLRKNNNPIEISKAIKYPKNDH